MTSDSIEDRWSELFAKEAPHSIRHVSIRQLLKARLPYEKALFEMELDGKKFKRVVVVGNVLEKTIKPNQIAYELDDGSGRIMARFWRDPVQDQQDSLCDDSEFRFVRAVGELNEFKAPARGIKKKSLLLESLEYIEDAHEIFHHILQIIVDTQTALYGQPPNASARLTPSEMSGDSHELQLHPEVVSDLFEDEERELAGSVGKSVDADSILETPVKVRNARYLPPPSPTPLPRPKTSRHERHTSVSHIGSVEAGPSRLPKRKSPTSPESPQKDQSSDLKLIILSVINEGMHTLRMSRPKSAYQGVGREYILEQVLTRTRNNSSSQINKSLRYLVDRADIYETVDENHFNLLK